MKRTVMIITLLLLVFALWGCGRGESTETRKADLEGEVLPLLEDSIRAMVEMKGYRMRGYMEMGVGGENATGSGNLRMDTQSEVENVEGRTNQHMRMDMGGMVTEAYIYGDYFYEQVPGRGWVKTSVARYQAQNLATGVIGEEQLRLILETVEEAAIRDGEDDEMEVTLVLGEDFLLRSLERFRAEMEEESQGQMEEWISAMKEAAGGFGATLRLVLGKDDHYIREMEMSIEMKDVPQLGSYRSRMYMEIYDYGAEIEIKLPAEAEKAALQ
ncbi:MAG: DUF6612 family protein [Actinomycetota bacterium]